MTSACRPLTAWRHMAALLCAAALLAPRPAEGASCTDCVRTSLGLAPRSYPAGDAPVAAAAADLDGDGRADLVVANNPPGAGKVRVLLGGPNGFVAAGSYDQSPVPRGLAAADFDTDGAPDVVVALGDSLSGVVQILRNVGSGNLNPVPLVSRAAGFNTSAVVVGDFDGNGASDVAAASEDSNLVFVFLGDGKGSLDSGHVTPVGARPRALVAGHFDDDGVLDLAVACAGDDQVRVLKGSGDGAFTPGPILGVGDEPVSIAAADLEPDDDLDLVTANRTSSTVSVVRNLGAGTFDTATTHAVDAVPTGVAALPVDDNARADIVTSNAGNFSVNLLLDDGPTAFKTATPHYVRSSPQAVVAVDADADGRLDVAVPCKGSNAVVVLLTRPPAFGAAVRYTVGSQPVAAVAVDLDGDTDIDLAVANRASSTVSILLNNGAGTLLPFGLPLPVRTTPSAIVAGDFDRDGTTDLAVSSVGTGQESVSVLRGTGGGSFAGFVWFLAGSGPDDLVAGDVDGDGDLDLLVCNRVSSGQVAFLRNTSSVGSMSFATAQLFAVGQNPTAIFAGRLNADAYLDFAVANDTDATLTVRYGDGLGGFPTLQAKTLALTGGDENPTAVVGTDFDGDLDIDLAVTVLKGGAVSVFRNDGASFGEPPTRIPAAYAAEHAVAADINLDGKTDLAIAAEGLEVLRGQASVTSFEAGEDFVAGLLPDHVLVADFSRDGRPDVAVVNKNSNDVSVLLGTGCTARRLEVIEQPAPSCLTGAGPYAGLQAVVETRDDGGNLACPAGDVTAAIVPGTGALGATLSGAGSPPALLPTVSLSSGVASFTVAASSSLTIDKAGKRYRLQFALPSLPGVPPAVSQSFTLGAQVAILGPKSFCPGGQANYLADDPGYDQYLWTLDGAPTPFAYGPSIILKEPPTLSLGPHTLTLEARVDRCAPSSFRNIWYRAWLSTALSASGPTTVCVDCLGGTVTPSDQGGGAVQSRQWGYRTASGPAEPVTPIGGETAGTYVVKGTDFPGPGTYYLVVTTGFTCPTTPSVSDELPIVVTPQVATSEVQSLAVTSRGSGASRENLLQWVNSTGSPDEICIRWNQAPDGTPCTFPSVPDCQTGSNWHQILSPAPDALGSWSHKPVAANTSYCYAVFVRDDLNNPPWSPGRVVKGRAFDADAGPVKWAYSTGATAVVPPVVGHDAVLAVSNDRTVHALTRGSTGGVWPAGWVPRPLEGVAHSRSPVVPFSAPVGSASSIFFAGDDRGWVQAVNAANGQTVWARRADQVPGPATITGAPGAILQQYGGNRDLVLVGTRRDPAATHSDFLGLDPRNPDNRVTFTGGGTPFQELGPVSGSSAVDYTLQRAYFASRRRAGGHTVWALDVGASSLTYAWSIDPGGEFDTSPVLRKGRVYVGDTAGSIYSIKAEDGSDVRSRSMADGAIKGFPFPDRRNDNLIFATSSTVWCVRDTPGGFLTQWSWTIGGLTPSTILHWPQTNYVYVGGRNGRLYQLNFTDATETVAPTHVELILGDGQGQIGAPTMDIGVAPPNVSAGKSLLIVGSESGVLYGVEVPF